MALAIACAHHTAKNVMPPSARDVGHNVALMIRPAATRPAAEGNDITEFWWSA